MRRSPSPTLLEVNRAGIQRSVLPDDIITGRTGIVGGIVGDTSIEQAVPVKSSNGASLDLSSESGTPAGGFLVLTRSRDTTTKRSLATNGA